MHEPEWVIVLPPDIDVCPYCRSAVVPTPRTPAGRIVGVPHDSDSCHACGKVLITLEASLLGAFVHAESVEWEPRLLSTMANLDKRWAKVAEAARGLSLDQSPIVLTHQVQYGWLTGVLVPQHGEIVFLFVTFGTDTSAPATCSMNPMPIEGAAVDRIDELRRDFEPA